MCKKHNFKNSSKGQAFVPRAILFDLDGTILDSGELIMSSMRYAVNEFAGYSYTDRELGAGVGTPLMSQLELLAPKNTQAVFDEYQIYNKKHHDEKIKIFPEIKDVLQVIFNTDIPLAIVTSKRHEPALRGLSLFNIEHLFQFVLGSDDVKYAKPHPYPVKLAAQKLGCSPKETWFIGDSPHDIEAGTKAGAYTIAVTWGMFELGDLLKCEPDLVIHQPRELINLLEESR